MDRDADRRGRGGAEDAPASVSFRVDDGLAPRLGVVVGGGLDERGETLARVRRGVGLGGIGARKHREESSSAHRDSIIPSLSEGTSAPSPGLWCRAASARRFRRANRGAKTRAGKSVGATRRDARGTRALRCRLLTHHLVAGKKISNAPRISARRAPTRLRRATSERRHLPRGVSHSPPRRRPPPGCRHGASRRREARRARRRRLRRGRGRLRAIRRGYARISSALVLPPPPSRSPTTTPRAPTPICRPRPLTSPPIPTPTPTQSQARLVP